MRNSRRGLIAIACVAIAASVVGGQTPHTNRLISQRSPCLQLHAHDPVDWFPWGAEAFEKARREGKPIFLSVGYSTCHWCHVMQAESFSNPAIAELMNRYFVSIKVDREERPDVDRVYMSYVLTVSGGGWPMSVFLTPELKPFFGATYVPPDDRNGEPGVRSLMTGLGELWAHDRDKAVRAARSGTQAIETLAAGSGTSTRRAGAAELDETYKTLRTSYDAVDGGFGAEPKFPRPVVLNLLLRYHARTGARPALDMTLGTLQGMARGGIHDHLGGGFHRYSTDRSWHVPHFEKMLYDQAQLAVSYTEAYQITKDASLAGIAREILDYVMRDMRSEEGSFFRGGRRQPERTRAGPEHRGRLLRVDRR